MTKTLAQKMLKDYPDVLSISDLQHILGIGRNLAYRLITNNNIKHTRAGRKIIIPKIYIIEFLVSVAIS